MSNSVTPWISAHQASLSITNSRSSPKLVCVELVMPSSHLIFYSALLLLHPIPLFPYIPANQEKVKHCHALESNIFLSQNHATPFPKNLHRVSFLLPDSIIKFLNIACWQLNSCWLPPHLAMAPTKSLYKCFTLESSTYCATDTRSFTSLGFFLHCFLNWEHPSTLFPSSFSAQNINPSANFL